MQPIPLFPKPILFPNNPPTKVQERQTLPESSFVFWPLQELAEPQKNESIGNFIGKQTNSSAPRSTSCLSQATMP